MRYKLARFLIVFAVSIALCTSASGQAADDRYISPTRPVPVGKAPAMKVKLVKDAPEEKVYAVIFSKGDDAMSGLTDFAIQNHIEDAHFTGIGAVNGATLAWLDPAAKIYHRIPVTSRRRFFPWSETCQSSTESRSCICMRCSASRTAPPSAVTSLNWT
jgi:hypothetical protein